MTLSALPVYAGQSDESLVENRQGQSASEAHKEAILEALPFLARKPMALPDSHALAAALRSLAKKGMYVRIYKRAEELVWAAVILPLVREVQCQGGEGSADLTLIQEAGCLPAGSPYDPSLHHAYEKKLRAYLRAQGFLRATVTLQVTPSSPQHRRPIAKVRDNASPLPPMEEGQISSFCNQPGDMVDICWHVEKGPPGCLKQVLLEESTRSMVPIPLARYVPFSWKACTPPSAAISWQDRLLWLGSSYLAGTPLMTRAARASVRERLLQAYHQLGYLDAVISSSVRSGGGAVRLTFHVQPGIRYRCRQVIWEGYPLSVDPAQLTKLSPLQPGDYVSLETLRQSFLDRTHPLSAYLRAKRIAVVSPPVYIKGRKQGVLDLAIDLQPPPDQILSQVHVQGARQMEPAIIDYLLKSNGLTPGAGFSAEKLQESYAKFIQTGLFLPGLHMIPVPRGEGVYDLFISLPARAAPLLKLSGDSESMSIAMGLENGHLMRLFRGEAPVGGGQSIYLSGGGDWQTGAKSLSVSYKQPWLVLNHERWYLSAGYVYKGHPFSQMLCPAYHQASIGLGRHFRGRVPLFLQGRLMGEHIRGENDSTEWLGGVEWLAEINTLDHWFAPQQGYRSTLSLTTKKALHTACSWQGQCDLQLTGRKVGQAGRMGYRSQLGLSYAPVGEAASLYPATFALKRSQKEDPLYLGRQLAYRGSGLGQRTEGTPFCYVQSIEYRQPVPGMAVPVQGVIFLEGGVQTKTLSASSCTSFGCTGVEIQADLPFGLGSVGFGLAIDGSCRVSPFCRLLPRATQG